MAVTSTFSSGTLFVFGDALDNAITVSRNAAGTILVNGGAVPVVGGTPTVANTSLIEVFGQGGNDPAFTARGGVRLRAGGQVTAPEGLARRTRQGRTALQLALAKSRCARCSSGHGATAT